MNQPGSGSVLLLEPFYGGSHRQLIDLLQKAIPQCTLLTLPASKWHWRARTSALYFAFQIPHDHSFRVLFASSVLNLAELIALRPDLLGVKKVIYFHENQLVYPVRKQKDRDFQYGYNQILSCLVADVIVFNSSYNQESFLTSIDSFLKLMPNRPRNVADKIRPKCQVLYFPLEFPTIACQHVTDKYVSITEEKKDANLKPNIISDDETCLNVCKENDLSEENIDMACEITADILQSKTMSASPSQIVDTLVSKEDNRITFDCEKSSEEIPSPFDGFTSDDVKMEDKTITDCVIGKKDGNEFQFCDRGTTRKDHPKHIDISVVSSLSTTTCNTDTNETASVSKNCKSGDVDEQDKTPQCQMEESSDGESLDVKLEPDLKTFITKLERQDSSPLHIVWPHRWEHDKNPDLFFSVLFQLVDEGCDFKLSVLGENYLEVPAIFEVAKSRLRDHIIHWGFLPSKQHYYEVLAQADVVVSTANHEFFGVAMLEATHVGCIPICPNRLVYPEIFPSEYLYRTSPQLVKKLRRFCKKPDLARTHLFQGDLSKYSWDELKAGYSSLFEVDA